MSERATKWSVTCNLKNTMKSTVESCISTARQRGWTVLGQIEKGTDGTEHYQLAVATPQVRFHAVKSIFPTAHIEVARDWHALVKYCQKEETRVGRLIKIEYVTFHTVRDKFITWLLQEGLNVHLTCPEDRVRVWDEFIGLSVAEGVECDIVGVNPQYRSCIMKYWEAYISFNIRRQTDRQTEEIVIPTIDIPEDGSTEEALSEEETDEEADGSSSPF